MPRSILVSNGQFAVALDDKAQIRDVYFPYVGLENHAVGHPFRFGVWVDGVFSWLDEGWQVSMSYMPETLTSRYKIGGSGIEIEVNDAVYHTQNLFLEKSESQTTQTRNGKHAYSSPMTITSTVMKRATQPSLNPNKAL